MLQRNLTNGKDMRQQLKEELRALEEKEELEEEEARDPTSASFVWPEKFTPEQRIAIGEGIREARLKANITQGQLSRFIKRPDNYMSSIEQGKVAKIDKALLKSISQFVRDDFNDLIKRVCAPRRHVSGEAIAEAGVLLEDTEKTYKIKGPDFDIKCTLDNDTFMLTTLVEGVEIRLFKGKRDKHNLYLKAWEKVIGLIRKGI